MADAYPTDTVKIAEYGEYFTEHRCFNTEATVIEVRLISLDLSPPTKGTQNSTAITSCWLLNWLDTW
jgi:hypothetical protein